ncbi:MAG: response regulator [Cytophagales bacterium]|nr:response regulator [Cytophagales bacterium]
MDIKLLTIDDDPIYHVIIKSMAKQFSLDNLIFALNGQKAMNLLEELVQNGEHLPNVILLDLNMPYVNGWEFLNWYQPFLENIEERPKLYICSSSDDVTDIQQSKNYNCVTGYFTKPLSKESFEQVITE